MLMKNPTLGDVITCVIDGDLSAPEQIMLSTHTRRNGQLICRAELPEADAEHPAQLLARMGIKLPLHPKTRLIEPSPKCSGPAHSKACPQGPSATTAQCSEHEPEREDLRGPEPEVSTPTLGSTPHGHTSSASAHSSQGNPQHLSTSAEVKALDRNANMVGYERSQPADDSLRRECLPGEHYSELAVNNMLHGRPASTAQPPEELARVRGQLKLLSSSLLGKKLQELDRTDVKVLTPMLTKLINVMRSGEVPTSTAQ